MTRINQATIDLVKRFEGLRLNAYLDPVGVLTIGYGYTNRAGFGPGVKSGDTWTEDQAEAMLIEGLEKFARQIRPLFTRNPTDNEFGAMLSLSYNIGTGAFSKSTALRRFNAGDTAGAAEAITWFNKAGGRVMRGLVRRREAERQLFLSEPEHINAAIVPDAPRQTAAQSKTIWAQAVQAVGAVGAGAAAWFSDMPENVQLAVIGAAALIVVAGIVVFRERLKHWANGVR